MLALRRNILLFQQAALGDFVVTWPIAMAAGRLWPTQRVIYVTTSDRGALAARAIGVESREIETTTSLFAENAEPPEAIARLLSGATAIVSFVSDGNDTWARNVARLSGDAKRVFVRARPDESDERPITEFFAEQIDDVPLRTATMQMLQHLRANGLSRSGRTSDDVLIHPGSGGKDKCWPLDRFVAVAKALREAGRHVIFALGEAERERLSAADRKTIDAVEPKSGVELFERVRAARLYLGNDSGPTHLAAVSGTPTIRVAGGDARRISRWVPIGPRVESIVSNDLRDIGVETVVERLLATPDVGTAPAVAAEDDA